MVSPFGVISYLFPLPIPRLSMISHLNKRLDESSIVMLTQQSAAHSHVMFLQFSAELNHCDVVM